MKSPSKTNPSNTNALTATELNQKNSYELNDKESDKLIDEVVNLLSDDFDLAVDKNIEKQIFAFSHRELLASNHDQVKDKTLVSELQFVGTLNPKQWWRRLALPSFVAGGFVLTVLAFQTLWQPLLNNKNKGYISEVNENINNQVKMKQHAVEFVIDGSDPGNEISSASLSRLNREKNKQLAITEFNESKKRPDLDVRVTDEMDDGLFNGHPVRKGFIYVESTAKDKRMVKNEELVILNNNKVYTGSDLSKTPYPEKDTWFKNIVISFQKQEINIIRKEIIRFKSAYPQYEIEDKLKKLGISF